MTHKTLIALLVAALLGGILPTGSFVVASVMPPSQEQSAQEPPPASPGTFRAASSAATTPITTLALGKPSGVTTNDVLLAAISVDGTPSITPPSGWTLVRSDANGSVMTQAV
jgi:hypothetical protein